MRLPVVLLLGLFTTACGAQGPDQAPAGDAGWTRAADPPLSARHGPLLAWTGSEVLALGGHTGPACPPNADCVDLDDEVRDGAAYDPGTDTWRPVAPAPFDVDRFTGHVVVDGDLVVGDQRRWWSYDTAADTWTRLPDGAGGVPEAERGGLVHTHDGRRVQVLDLATSTWAELPPDPLQPALEGGAVFATDAGVVLTGVSYREAPPNEPTLTQADLWDGSTWRRLPRTGMIGPLLHWTGERLVGAGIGGADGGEVNGWDRAYPFGGALDPATGAWSELPGAPGYEDLDDSTWRLEAAAGTLVATAGFVYDDADGTWTPLGRPESTVREDVAAVFAGDRLVTVGGTDADLRPVLEAWVRTR